MNKLFSMLMQGYVIPADSWYYKKTSFVPASSRSAEIVAILMTGVPEARKAMYAAVLCNLALLTQYGEEIKKLDPNNTYVEVTRPTSASHSMSAYCMHDLIQPARVYKALVKYLGDDIMETLDTNSWIDLMGAGCLQLLREAL